ncbi:MAG: glutaredoxin family protein [Planctomycetota bacterium]|nr:glutaredoxin family protein [Planctomycetota bacterium]
MSWLDRLFRRRELIALTLYTGPSCSLCELVKAELHAQGAHRRFELREVDITTDRELKKRYGLSIPVLEIDGEALLSGRIEPDELRRVLKDALS